MLNYLNLYSVHNCALTCLSLYKKRSYIKKLELDVVLFNILTFVSLQCSVVHFVQ